MNKLVESFFAQEEKVLGVEELRNLLIREYRDSLSERTTQKQERVLKLPRLQISENWGKENTVERAELERIVDTATRGKVGAFEKLKVIQQQMTQLSSKSFTEIKNPRRILSQIMILETMNRLFKSFQPSPAGFINEALLSVFYGGLQKGAGQANVQKDIADVNDADGTPISIKTKGKGGLIVDGSIENLYTTINTTKNKKVYFDIYEKITTGDDKKGGHVGTLRVFRFYVDANNINDFLGKDYFNVVNGKLVPKGEFKVAGKETTKQQALEEATAAEKRNEVFNTIIASDKAFSEKEFENMLSQVKISVKNTVTFDKLIQSLKDAAREEKDSSKFEIMKKNISVLSNMKIAGRGKEEYTGGGLHREFAINQSDWQAFADQQGYIEDITLTFSDENITNMLESAVELLDRQIVEIFNNLDGFSNSISAYLTSITKNRNSIGEKALQYAAKLEPQTQQVIKTTAADDESNA